MPRFNGDTKQKRGRRPGCNNYTPEGNPELEFIKYPKFIRGTAENGTCDAIYYDSRFGDYEKCSSYGIKKGGRWGRHGGLSTGPRTERGKRVGAKRLELNRAKKRLSGQKA